MSLAPSAFIQRMACIYVHVKAELCSAFEAGRWHGVVSVAWLCELWQSVLWISLALEPATGQQLPALSSVPNYALHFPTAEQLAV